MVTNPISLKARLEQDLKDSLKAQNKERISIIRLIRGAISQREIDNQVTLGDKEVQPLLQSMVKQRREAIELFKTGQRPDLVAKETFELSVLSEYLPVQLSQEESLQLIQQTISETKACGIRDMGKVMSVLKTKVEGKADMAEISNWVKKLLTASSPSS